MALLTGGLGVVFDNQALVEVLTTHRLIAIEDHHLRDVRLVAARAAYGETQIVGHFFRRAWLALIARPCLAALALAPLPVYFFPEEPYLYPPPVLRTGLIVCTSFPGL